MPISTAGMCGKPARADAFRSRDAVAVGRNDPDHATLVAIFSITDRRNRRLGSRPSRWNASHGTSSKDQMSMVLSVLRFQPGRDRGEGIELGIFAK